MEESGSRRVATPESAGAGVEQTQQLVREHRTPVAAGGVFAAGFVLGWVIGRR
jgi:hypothetical protein